MPHPPLEAHVEYEIFRGRVADIARRGERPSDAFAGADLAEAFDGKEDELAELERLAREVRDRQLENQARSEAVDRLYRMVDTIIAEWDAAEAAERRKRAEVEALKRLGLDETA